MASSYEIIDEFDDICIARSDSGELFVYEKKPEDIIKIGVCISWNWGMDKCYQGFGSGFIYYFYQNGSMV